MINHYPYSIIEFTEEIESEWSIANQKTGPERNLSFKNMLSDLSQEAQEVVSLIFNTPDELLQMIFQTDKGLTQSIIRKYLRVYGWKHLVINEAFSEIQKGLIDLEN